MAQLGEQKEPAASTEKKQQPTDDEMMSPFTQDLAKTMEKLAKMQSTDGVIVNNLVQDLAEIGKILNQIKEGVVPIIKRMQKNDATSADDAKIKSDLVEKLRIELQKKDEELAKERQEKQKLAANLEKLSANLELEKARANKAVWELSGAKVAHARQKYRLCYHIKVKWPKSENDQSPSSGDELCLYADESDQLRLLVGRDQALSTTLLFKFTKNSNDTYSIYSAHKGKYLRTQTSSNFPTFSATDQNSAGHFVLSLYTDDQFQDGFLVDISSSSSAGSFLCVESKDNHYYIAAISRTPPSHKFLIK